MEMAHELSGQNRPHRLADQTFDDAAPTDTRRSGESRLLEMVAAGYPLPDILNAICRLVEDAFGECRCGIYLIDWHSRRIHTFAAPSLPASFKAAICGLPLRSETGPGAISISAGMPVVAADADSGPLWQASAFHSLAAAHGLTTCWSSPIHASARHVLGAIVILQGQPARPTPLPQIFVGKLAHIASIAIERAQCESALRRARSELARVAGYINVGGLTASIAHEVNQPLSGILINASTCVRMLTADPPDVEGARETMRRTLRDSKRAAELIARLRALFGKKEANAESVNLNEAAREVIALSLSAIRRSRATLRVELEDGLPSVMGDRIQLQQVILNLLLNALDAMKSIQGRPRQLVIRTERDQGDRVRLSVRDSGVGLDPHVADKIFDPFYSTKSDGMGIGLFVSRSIIENHHGSLTVTPNDGPGATFCFSIPRI